MGGFMCHPRRSKSRRDGPIAHACAARPISHSAQLAVSVQDNRLRGTAARVRLGHLQVRLHNFRRQRSTGRPTAERPGMRWRPLKASLGGS